MNTNLQLLLINTRSRATRLSVYFMAIALTLSSPLSMAQSGSDPEVIAAGRVIFVSGEVIAAAISGDLRTLERSSYIFEGDTIYTYEAARTGQTYR